MRLNRSPITCPKSDRILDSHTSPRHCTASQGPQPVCSCWPTGSTPHDHHLPGLLNSALGLRPPPLQPLRGCFHFSQPCCPLNFFLFNHISQAVSKATLDTLSRLCRSVSALAITLESPSLLSRSCFPGISTRILAAILIISFESLSPSLSLNVSCSPTEAASWQLGLKAPGDHYLSSLNFKCVGICLGRNLS